MKPEHPSASRTDPFKHLTLALLLGAGLGAGSAQAQTILDVGGADTIGTDVLTTAAGVAKVPIGGVNWSANGGAGIKYSTLKSPVLVVPTTGSVILRFTHRYNFETGWDGGAVYVSVNGAPATYLAGTAFAANGYVSDLSVEGSTVFTGGEKVFTGMSTDYGVPTLIESVADLGNLSANDTVAVEFRGGWDDATAATPAPNWEIGSVRITDSAATTILNADFTANGPSGFTVTSDAGLAGPWTYLKPVNRFEIDAATLAADRYAPSVPGSVIDLNGARLAVARLSGSLSAGQTYSLFDLSGGTTLAGTYETLSLPPGTWNTSNLAVNGTITLVIPAAPIFEPFADGNATLTGNTPGAGLSGTWDSSATVVSGSLNYGALALGTGNKVSAKNQYGGVSVGTTLSDAGLLADGKELWFSALIQTGGDIATNGDLGFVLGTDRIGSGNNIPILNNGQAMGVRFKNNLIRAAHWSPTILQSTGPAAAPNTLYLIVGKFIWGDASDTIEIYNVGPDLALGSPVSTYTTASNVDQSLFDTISFGSKDATPGHYIDEIRLGASVADVLPSNPAAPTLASADIVDNKSGGPILESETLVYTLTFSENINGATVDATDFENGGTAPITINNVTTTSNQVLVTVTPTFPGATGTLRLRVKAGAVIEDFSATPLATASPIADDTEITVNADSVPPTVVSITSPVAATPIYGLPTIPYTVTFDKYFMDDATVTVADFSNFGTASITVDSVTRVSTGTVPAVYLVQVTATTPGTVQLRLSGTVGDAMGNSVVVPVDDDTIYTLASPEPAKETITLDKFVSAYIAGTTKTFTFDASASDKLVVIVSGEHNFGGNTSGNVKTITYDGVSLTKAVEQNPVSATLQTTSDLWYMDNPGVNHTAGQLVITVEGNGNNYVHAALALSGTAPGFGGASAITIGSPSVNMLVSSPNSMAISWLTLGGSGNTAGTATTVQANSPAGATTFGGVATGGNYAGHVLARSSGLPVGVNTFSFGTALTDVLCLAAEFLAADKPAGTGYGTWAQGPFAAPLGDTSPSLDFDAGGLATGVEWVVGGDPTVGSDDLGRMPTFNNSDPNNLVFTFKRRDAAQADPNTTIAVQYGTDLSADGWTTATDGVNGVTIDATNVPEAGFHTVVVSIPKALAPGGRLFARLKVAVATP